MSMDTARAATLSATLILAGFGLSGCGHHWNPFTSPYPDAPGAAGGDPYTYIIGPGDSLEIFVWRNPELSKTVPVRPDGRVSAPLIEDIEASGRTPVDLARQIEQELAEYVRDPIVTITVNGFSGEYHDQIRVVGEATNPVTIPYSKNMTVLDVVIASGGLTEFAAGNRASIVRGRGEALSQYRVRLEDLIKDGDITANVAMEPGDILIIPEAWF